MFGVAYCTYLSAVLLLVQSSSSLAGGYSCTKVVQLSTAVRSTLYLFACFDVWREVRESETERKKGTAVCLRVLAASVEPFAFGHNDLIDTYATPRPAP